MENDVTIAQQLRDRLGGALFIDDILIVRAAGVWHRIQWELAAERDAGVAGRQRAPVVSAEQKRALKAAGMASRPARQQGLDNVYILDPTPVQGQLDRAEVATGYLHALYGIPAVNQSASYPSTDMEPALGRMAVIEVWDRIARINPELKLTGDEQAWTQAAIDNTEP